MARLRVLVGTMVFLLVAGGTLLLGQDSKDGTGKVRGQLPPNWGKLGLTDKQKATVYKIQADYRGRIEPLDKQIRKLRQQEREEMLKVLNEDQRTRLKEIISEKAGQGSSKEGETSKDKKQ